MTRKEIINRNIGLTFDFVRALIRKPSLASELASGSEIEFIEKDFPVKDEKSLNSKYIIRVSNSFSPVNRVAEPELKYGKKK